MTNKPRQSTAAFIAAVKPLADSYSEAAQDEGSPCHHLAKALPEALKRLAEAVAQARISANEHHRELGRLHNARDEQKRLRLAAEAERDELQRKLTLELERSAEAERELRAHRDMLQNLVSGLKADFVGATDNPDDPSRTHTWEWLSDNGWEGLLDP